ncbi:MAG: DUF3152 domain-containing protein [Williamsia herbipolensis]|nr:DUF3152 domain-containing protein [Williamsia herbipolensis]
MPQPLRASWDPITRQDPTPTHTRLRPRRPGTDGDPTGESGGPPRRSTARRRTAVGWFVHRYGWRAWALPVLVALTVVVVVQVARGPAGPVSVADTQVVGPTALSQTVSVPTTVVVTQTVPGGGVQTSGVGTSSPSASSPSGSSESLPVAPTVSGSAGPDPNGEYARSLAAGTLPVGEEFVAKGRGTYHVVPGRSRAFGSGPEKLTFTVEVEDGVQSTAKDKEFAASVVATLSDPRSWVASGDYTFQRIDAGEPSFRVSLTSQMTTREMCGYTIKLEASCFNSSRDERVVINDARWVRGAIAFNGDLGSYRVYAINHEVGHRLGFHHQPCTEQGGLAPVMMQQSFSTSNDDLHPLDVQNIPENGLVCKFNAFPFPRGHEG